jgi:hypothetical protein
MNKDTRRGILEAAITGYRAQISQAEQQIQQLQRQLRRGSGSSTSSRGAAGRIPPGTAVAKRQRPHKISPEGLKRIREAQKRRWTNYHKAHGAGAA